MISHNIPRDQSVLVMASFLVPLVVVGDSWYLGLVSNQQRSLWNENQFVNMLY